MKLQQNQIHHLSQQQFLGINVLQMSTLELTSYLRELAQENPVIELEEGEPAPESNQSEQLVDRLQWLENSDRQNRYYEHMDPEELEPVAQLSGAGGLEETLPQFLLQQLERQKLAKPLAQAVKTLIACLDKDGYFRYVPEDLAAELSLSLPCLLDALDVLRGLEPAGVGASSLSQCLALQLERIGQTGVVLDIVNNHLNELAKCHYHAIATKLGITEAEVLAAQQIIRELEPRPGASFQRPEQPLYVFPDIFVEEGDDGFVVRCPASERPTFQISSYYRELLAQSQDKEVRDYLETKLRQAKAVLLAIGQRKSTLERCARAIVDRQFPFFKNGPLFLSPLRMADLAQTLQIHESTVSRAVREKYLQCRWGVFPMSCFFSQATTVQGGSELSSSAARELLRQLIDQEDKAYPLSDQKLSEEMQGLGCPISRRIVAKYRDELNLPSTTGRRRR